MKLDQEQHKLEVILQIIRVSGKLERGQGMASLGWVELRVPVTFPASPPS